MQIFVNPKYDFLKWRWHAIAFSVVFTLAGLVFVMQKGVNLGVDFAGGANVILRFRENPPLDRIRSIVPDATVQEYGKRDERSLLLRLPKQPKEGDYAGQIVTKLHQQLNPEPGTLLDLNYQGRDALSELLKSKDPDNKGEAHDYYFGIAQKIIERRSEIGLFTSFDQAKGVEGVTPRAAQVIQQNTFLGSFNVLSQETVGPQVGKELQSKAIWAIILSTLAMGLYIGVRFDIKFGIGALACLIHDVAVSLAFLFMINGEFSLITVAAFLMIVGYSINDTVVVYDRVRENVKRLRSRDEFYVTLNRSLNQTLSRTVLTGGSVMLILLSLIFFGGEVINQFAWLLLVGTISGTYSTLFVVPAVVIIWERVAGPGKMSRA